MLPVYFINTPDSHGESECWRFYAVPTARVIFTASCHGEKAEQMDIFKWKCTL